MRVDVEIDYETLRWAAIQAVSLGISRRKFLFNCIEKIKNTETSLHILPLPATEDEKLAKDELIRKHPFYKVVYDKMEELFQKELDEVRSQLPYEKLPQEVKDKLNEVKIQFYEKPGKD